MINPDANAAAGVYWQNALQGYKKSLKYYDIGGFTTYNLNHLTHGLAPFTPLTYHNHHLALLNALMWATGDPVFTKYWKLWKNYVDTQSPIRPIHGDVNGDGLVTQADVTLAQSLVGQLPSSWTLQQLVATDLDDDGYITSADIPLIQASANQFRAK